MPQIREIRARFDRDSIVVYQAYSDQIAIAALKEQRFVAPFSFQRMTWVKPSFLWLMHRSQWGKRANQQRTLAVHIKRSGWDKALSCGVLTHPEPTIYRNPTVWEAEFQEAKVHIQWDTERTLRGAALNCFSIQVGISRHLIQEFVNDWIVRIEDLTPIVAKIRNLIHSGDESRAKQLLPSEKIYAVEQASARRIHLG
jgi:hypothetical protein